MPFLPPPTCSPTSPSIPSTFHWACPYDIDVGHGWRLGRPSYEQLEHAYPAGPLPIAAVYRLPFRHAESTLRSWVPWHSGVGATLPFLQGGSIRTCTAHCVLCVCGRCRTQAFCVFPTGYAAYLHPTLPALPTTTTRPTCVVPLSPACSRHTHTFTSYCNAPAAATHFATFTRARYRTTFLDIFTAPAPPAAPTTLTVLYSTLPTWFRSVGTRSVGAAAFMGLHRAVPLLDGYRRLTHYRWRRAAGARWSGHPARFARHCLLPTNNAYLPPLPSAPTTLLPSGLARAPRNPSHTHCWHRRLPMLPGSPLISLFPTRVA